MARTEVQVRQILKELPILNNIFDENCLGLSGTLSKGQLRER
jgi:hypothetical protein